MDTLKIIVTGGGSGGHTMPALAIVEELQSYCSLNSIELKLLYLGSKQSIEAKMAEDNNLNFKSYSTGKLRRYFSLKNFTDIFKIFFGIIQNIFIIFRFKPNVLMSTGGFVSVPPVIGAFLNRVPVVVHEQTISVGLANKIAAKFAKRICLTFDESAKYYPANKSVLTGLPIRDVIFSGTKKAANKIYNFDLTLPVLYFTGGGLGCHILNETTLEILPKLLEDYNVIFQTGKANDNADHKKFDELRNSLSQKLQKRFYLYDFITHNMGNILALATLAISRSGAGTVSEFYALTLPAIFIPLPFATKNEQFKNARFLEEKGGAIIIEEKNLTSTLLYTTIVETAVPERTIKMERALANKKIRSPKKEIIKVLIEVLK